MEASFYKEVVLFMKHSPLIKPKGKCDTCTDYHTMKDKIMYSKLSYCNVCNYPR